ncbi:MAG: phosphatidate cytidylyltransferase [Lachnospiraceae bacterium]|nr:phosphatidate cytidylyltransferase [Lachnospiraceae bacterium]
MFKTRLLSGIILVAAAVALVTAGGDALLVGLATVSLVGQFELYRVFHIEKSLVGAIGYLGTALYYASLREAFLPGFEAFALGLLVFLMAAYVFSFPKYKADQVFAGFAGAFYVPVMLAGIYQTRALPSGAYLVWLIFLCSWGCDTCAYCVGVLVGKHKMAPKLSPKKSVEGAVGGCLGTALLTLLYGFLFRGEMGLSENGVFLLAGIAAVGALISMVGDLAASAIKRNYGIKDYGKLIPGHGGVLDRFDSVIFTAPIIYYLGQYLM